MENIQKLSVGAFQFAACDSAESNLRALKRGIELAATQNVRLLLTQECALCGYPPVEIPSVEAVNPSKQTEALVQISLLAQKYRIYIALGMIIFNGLKAYNSIQMIQSDGRLLKPYHKRALWGWDKENFSVGKEPGIYDIDGFKVGVRLCYEVRFPEYFRELFIHQVDLALVSFADIGKPEQRDKLNVIQSHLVSRAAENAMFLLSANSTSGYQLAPTCFIDPDGNILDSAPLNQEYLITTDIEKTEPGFGRQGRILHSIELVKR